MWLRPPGKHGWSWLSRRVPHKLAVLKRPAAAADEDGGSVAKRPAGPEDEDETDGQDETDGEDEQDETEHDDEHDETEDEHIAKRPASSGRRRYLLVRRLKAPPKAYIMEDGKYFLGMTGGPRVFQVMQRVVDELNAGTVAGKPDARARIAALSAEAD